MFVGKNIVIQINGQGYISINTLLTFLTYVRIIYTSSITLNSESRLWQGLSAACLQEIIF